MINWFGHISHKFDTKLFFGDCDNTPSAPYLRAIAWLWDDHSPTSPRILVLSKWKRHAIVSYKKDFRDEFTFTIASRMPYESHTRTKGKGNIRDLCDSYWRMISFQKGLVDSDFNFCSVQQWSCSSFAFICIVTPRATWEVVVLRFVTSWWLLVRWRPAYHHYASSDKQMNVTAGKKFITGGIHDFPF